MDDFKVRTTEETASADSFDKAHALGRARANLAAADAALREAHVDFGVLGDGPRGRALPQRLCEEASELVNKVRLMLLDAIKELR